MMLSDVCLSVVYIGPPPKSRTERPGKTKIGTELAHVTRDSDTTFKDKRSKVKDTGDRGILWQPPAQLVCFMMTMTIDGGDDDGHDDHHHDDDERTRHGW